MTIYVVTCVTKGNLKDDCRSISLIEAIQYRGERRIVLSPEEAFALVASRVDRLWVRSKDGFVPVIPVTQGKTRYVRTEPADTSNDVLLKQPKCHGKAQTT